MIRIYLELVAFPHFYRCKQLLLSVEHSGFTFIKDLSEAAQMLELHSGGKCSEALSMAYCLEAPTSSAAASLNKQSPVDLLPPPDPASYCCCFGC